ncbi:MAG: hormogonium polysaccharide biosynthesis glycosyltransferase HpsE [Phormidesmis sp.]
MVDFTVAIPTYNGAQRLSQLLERLRSQTGTEHFSWAILVVDNNSSDNTADVVRQYQAKFSQKGSDTTLPEVHYAFEKRQGAAFARLKAMATATTEWVGFLDDDVIPAPDWVATAYAFGQDHPKAGAYGGQIHGAFEVDPPENFSRIQSFLAIRERGPKPHLYNPDTLNLPPSAAWVVRAQAWHENVSRQPKLGGRAHGSMVQGDDYEPLLRMHKAQWEIWYAPDMQVAHQIPKARLEWNYLTSLSRGCGLCVCPLRMINADPWQRPFIWSKITLGSLRRVIRHWIRYRHELKTDLIAACEMEFFLGSFMSSFDYLKTLLTLPNPQQQKTDSSNSESSAGLRLSSERQSESTLQHRNCETSVQAD